ncbi:MAG: hypothetical protein COA79_20625 [Planctomycetota bacterium]|nr:MAG: hypothetical protein COA79_20625 [Planctomycetota bacterium]
MTWSFIQMSDIHIGVKNEIKFQPSWVENFFTAIEQIKQLEIQPDFLIVTGDMTRDGKSKPNELENVKRIFKTLDWPVYFIPGNHDVGNRYRDDKSNVINQNNLDSYRKIMGDDKFLFEHKGIQFVGFNSFLFSSNLEKDESQQWDWLEEQANNSTQSKLWFMHSIPFIDSPEEVEPKIDTAEWYYTIGKNSAQRLVSILKKGNVNSLSNGHVHIHTKRNYENIDFINCPSSAFITEGNNLEGKRFLGFLEWQIDGETAKQIPHKLSKISELEGIGFNPGVPISSLN